MTPFFPVMYKPYLLTSNLCCTLFLLHFLVKIMLTIRWLLYITIMHTYWLILFALCEKFLKNFIFPGDLCDIEEFISKFSLLLIRKEDKKWITGVGERIVSNTILLFTTFKLKLSCKHCAKGSFCFWWMLASTDCVFWGRLRNFLQC